MAADPFIPRVFSGDDRLRRHSERVAQVLNSLIRNGQLARGAAADVWKLVAGAVAAGSVTNAMLANMATARLKGRVTAGTGSPEDLTGTQATTLLDVFTALLKGLTPASGGGTTNFLRADGSWAVPPGGGGGSSTLTPPVLASFSFVNQGTATATTPSTSAGVWFRDQAGGAADNVRLLVQALPAAPWTLVCGFRPACGVGAGIYGLVGPALYDSGSGKIKQVRYGGHEGGTGVFLSVEKFTNVTTNAGDLFSAVAVPNHRGADGGYYVKITDDATTLRYFVGPDPEVMELFYSEARTTFATADKAGFGLNPFSEVAAAHWTHWTLV